MATLPYLASPGSLKTALDKIRLAATPDRVTGDFVNTKLQIKGGTGSAITPYLKKIGFIAGDGTPTDLYKRFRNHATAGHAVAEAVKVGYKNLEAANEYFYDLNDKDLLALIVQVTGAAANSQVAKFTLSTLKTLKGYADFEAKPAEAAQAEVASPAPSDNTSIGAKTTAHSGRGLNLSYTINLNLPATADQAVFNAIFRSLKEHLLSS